MKGLDVAPEHLHIIMRILQKYVPQYAVWAFGSRVKGTAKPYSDLDLAVITTEKALPLSVHAALAEAFSESDLPWKVDIIDWHLASPDFRRIIESRHIVLK